MPVFTVHLSLNVFHVFTCRLQSELTLSCQQLTQKYVGHITIVPDIRLPELLTFFSNPSEEFCQQAIIKGERSTCKCMSLSVMTKWCVRKKNPII